MATQKTQRIIALLLSGLISAGSVFTSVPAAELSQQDEIIIATSAQENTQSENSVSTEQIISGEEVPTAQPDITADGNNPQASDATEQEDASFINQVNSNLEIDDTSAQDISDVFQEKEPQQTKTQEPQVVTEDISHEFNIFETTEDIKVIAGDEIFDVETPVSVHPEEQFLILFKDMEIEEDVLNNTLEASFEFPEELNIEEIVSLSYDKETDEIMREEIEYEDGIDHRYIYLQDEKEDEKIFREAAEVTLQKAEPQQESESGQKEPEQKINITVTQDMIANNGKLIFAVSCTLKKDLEKYDLHIKDKIWSFSLLPEEEQEETPVAAEVTAPEQVQEENTTEVITEEPTANAEGQEEEPKEEIQAPEEPEAESAEAVDEEKEDTENAEQEDVQSASDEETETPDSEGFEEEVQKAEEEQETIFKAAATGVYAVLYDNGDLVFQEGDEPDASRGTVVQSWTGFDNTASHPWSGNSSVKKVVFNTTVSPTSCANYFYNMDGLVEIENIENLNTSNATAMNQMFYDCDNLLSVDLSALNTERVTRLDNMFYSCDKLTSVTMNTNTSNVTQINGMFYAFPRLMTVDMDTCDFNKVTSAYNMFNSCTALRTVNSSNWGFGALTSGYSMFSSCYELTDVDVSNWHPANLYTAYNMFYGCRNLRMLDLSNWNCSRLYNAYQMFMGCSKLTSVYAPNWTFSNNAIVYSMFQNCTALSNLDISGWTIASPSSIYSFLSGTQSLGSVDLSGWDNSVGRSISSFFYNSGIAQVTLGDGWRFTNDQLPTGNWQRVSTEEVYTSAQLRSAWNSTMADTYRKVAVINFDGNGGNASKKKKVGNMGEPLDELPDATRDGYTFIGWFTDPKAGTQLHEGDPVTQIKYYAHWQENTYTLILKRNVEDDPDDTEERIDLTYTQIYTLDPTIFENEDKVLQGWTVNRDNTGKMYGPSERVVMLAQEDGATYTLYAKWGRTRNATIEFDSQDGSEVEAVVIERGSVMDYKTYQVPYREGYSFKGWWTEPNGEGVRYDNVNRTIDNNITLYAYWVKDPIVSFNPNGGWVETFTRTVPYGTAIGALPKSDNRPEKLIGFYTSQEPGEGTKLTESTVFTEDATYYAHWGYQPVFNTTGGKFSGSFNLNSVYPVDYPAERVIDTLPTVVRDGYEFVRWELGDGTEVHAGDTINLHDFPEIIAVWQLADQATVTFNSNGGSFPSGQTSTYMVKQGAELGYYPLPTKNINGRRMEFLGWYDDEDNLITPDTVINEDMTLTAKWGEKLHKLTFDPQGGVNVASTNGSGVNTRYLADGEKLGIVPGTRRDNHVLEGWYSEPNGQGEKLTADTVVTEDTVWYANWINNHQDKTMDEIAYRFWTEWSNASNDNVDNIGNNLNFHPTSNNTQTASLHLHFELNSQVATSLPTGSVRVRIPKYVWKNWDGNNTGSNNISAQMPVYPKIQSGMWFSYYEDGDEYVLVNNQPLSGGAGIDMTISYQADPMNIPGGAIDSNGDYIDGYPYFQNTVPVTFTIDKDFEIPDGQTMQTATYNPNVEENVDLTLEMHTKVNQTISKSFTSMYYEWQNSWGTKPADADDYFYLYWTTRTYVGNTTQPWKYSIREAAMHDGTVVYGQSASSSSYSSSSGVYNYLYTVTKHPKSLLEEIPSSGITFTNESERTTEWKSGYKETVAAKASYTLREWKYTKGEFDKTNTSSSVRTITGGQEDILNGDDVAMTWELHYDGISRDTPLIWHEDTETYEAQQRVIAISDGVNGDLFYSSGSPNSKYVWEPVTGNYVLEDDDYTINRLSIYTREYDGSYVNNEWGGPTVNNETAKWKDLDIYVRYRNTDELVFWKSVRPVNGHNSGSVSVTLPNDVVGYEVRYPTSYFRTYLQVYMYTTIHPTANIRSLIYNDTMSEVTSIIKNRGYCNIWTSDEWWTNPDTEDVRFDTHTWTRDTNPNHDIFFHVTDWTGGLNGANKEIYELNKTSVHLYAQKFSAADRQVVLDVERGFQENPMAVRGWTYASSGKVKNIKNGTFYDLLPRGATVPEDSIFAVLSSNNRNGSYNTTTENAADSYESLKADTASHLAREYYNIRFIENWENSGRTMMEIRFMVPENQKRNMATFYYMLHMTYSDIVNYGTSVENDVAFVDDSIRDYDYYQSYNSQSVITEREYYDLINQENDWVAHGAADTHYIPVDAFSWGFDKSVKTRTEYVTKDTTIPNNEYTYRINFSQSDYATSDSIVFYDVLEAGAYNNEGVLEKETEWNGYFESIDVSSLESKLKKDSTTVHCAPVVYYSVKPREEFTGADYNVDNAETWTTTMPADKKTITAVAVDCRYASDGTPFVQFGRQSMAIYITMRAPISEENIGKIAVNQAKIINRVYEQEPPDEPSEATSDTEVKIENEEPEIHKESAPETGTQEEPTVVSYGDDLTYTITVTNKNETFTVNDFIVEDDMPEGVQVKTAEIKVHFGNPENAASVSVSPRIDMRVRNKKLIFNINSLAAGETAYIIVPTRVIARGDDEPVHNQAKITSVNGIDKEIESEITWHEVQYDVIFSKQSDRKQLVPGAHLQLFDADTEELIEEWVTTKANKTIRLYIGNFLLRETEVPDGYAIADDIRFSVQPDGTILYENGDTDTKVVMVDVASTEVKGQKTWKWDDAADRPESITVVLQRNGEDYRELETSAADNWAYDFGKVPKYDAHGVEYEYSVIERPVDGYTPTYESSKQTNGLALTFSSKTSTYDYNDKFSIYYLYKGKMFCVNTWYGKEGTSNNPAGQTIYIPSDNFYMLWNSNNAGNDYGFKFDSIMPVVFTERVGFRADMPDIGNTVIEEVSGNKYPETDHEYFINESIAWHYSREMENDILDIVNTKNSDEFTIPIHKVSESGELLGGVVITLTSEPEPGDAEIEPITFTTTAGTPYEVELKPGTYRLHEESAIEGYQYAEDVVFQVDKDGNVLIDGATSDHVEMLDKYAEQPYPFRKTWMDAGQEEYRPESVTFQLIRVSDGEVVATKSLTEENAVDDSVWEGAFDPVLVIDEQWNPIEYVVREVVNGNDYRVYHDAQNKTGFYVTFTEDSNLGSTGKMWIYPGGRADEQPRNYISKAQLMLNPEYGMAYAEGTDMAGKTYYVPILDGVEAFTIERTWGDDAVKLEIESIFPAFEEQPYELSTGGALPPFTNIFSGKNYPNLNEDGERVSTYKWASQLDTEDGIVLESEIVNYVNRTDVPFTKEWDDINPEDRPQQLTFTLYNELDLETPVQEITVDVTEDQNQEYAFTGVPKYNDDWSLAKYVIIESEVEGYKTFYSPGERPGGFLVTFSNDSTVGNGYLVFYGQDGEKLSGAYAVVGTSYSSNITELRGEQIPGKTYYVPVMNSDHPGFAMFVYDSDRQASVHVTSIVPVDYRLDTLPSAGTGMPLQYANEFVSGQDYPNFTMEGKNRSGWYCIYDYVPDRHVYNSKDETAVPITKIWSDTDAENRPEQITVEIYNINDADTTLATAELSVNDAKPENADEWTKTVSGLPKYNADGTLAQYAVRERHTEGYHALYGKPKGILVTFSEDSFAGYENNGYINTSYIELAAVQLSNYPAIAHCFTEDNQTGQYIYGYRVKGNTFYVPILHDGEYAFAVYNHSANQKIKIENVRLTTEDPEHSYTYNVNLALSQVPAENRYEGTGSYDLTGKAGWHLYTYTGVVGEQIGSGEYTIINDLDKTEIPVNKIWADTGHEDKRPETVTITAYNIKDKETPVGSVTMSAENANGEYEWSGVITDLPKYNEDGSIAKYILRESETEDYQATYGKPKGMIVRFSEDTLISGQASNSFTIFSTSGRGEVTAYAVGPQTAGTTSINGTVLRNAGNEIYVPIEEDGVYTFMVQLGNANSTVRIESVELTNEERTVYKTTATIPYNAVAAENKYQGTGAFDLSGKTGPYMYTYTGATDSIAQGMNYATDGTVINNINITDIPFRKIWEDTGYEADRPDSLTFQLVNERDKDTVIAEKTLTRTEVEEGNEWSGTFENIPKYNEDGSIAVYCVKESEVPSGYTEKSSISGVKGFLLTFSEDTDLTDAYLYITQSDGHFARNYITPGQHGSYYTAFTQYTPIAGKTIYVPLYNESVPEFWVELYRTNTSATPHYEITSIVPVYENVEEAYVYSTGNMWNSSYIYAQNNPQVYYMHNDVSAFERDFSELTTVNTVYDLFRWDINKEGAYHVTNSLIRYPVKINKYSNAYPTLPGSTLQIIRNSDDAVIFEYTTDLYDKDFMLSPGEYTLHETVAPQGFRLAEDVVFTVGSDGTVTVDEEEVNKVRMSDPETIDLRGVKSWAGDDETKRPASITVNLLQDGEIIDSKEITAEDEWKYEFTGLDKYSAENGHQYTYTISENTVYDYRESVLPPSTQNSWMSNRLSWPSEETPATVERVTHTSQIPTQGLSITFSSSSKTESTSFDWLYIYYRKNGTMYRLSSKYGGTSGSYMLSNRTIYVPSNDVYFVWRTDSSVTYYGWSITNITPLSYTPSVSATTAALPTVDGSYRYTTYEGYSGTHYPQTTHNYGNNERKIWHYTGASTVTGQTTDYTISGKGLKLKLNEDAYSEGSSTDYIQVYFRANGTLYRTNDYTLSGDMGNREIIVPSRDVYLYWRTDGSVKYYGWDVVDVEELENVTVEECQTASMPSYTTIKEYSGDNYPSTEHPYDNNLREMYHYSAYETQLPDESQRNISLITANLLNTRLPDKIEVSVYKKNTTDENVAGASLKITGHETGASYDIEPIEWTTTAEGPKTVQLRQGSYVLQETAVPAGYLKAKDVPFIINEDNEIVVKGEVTDAVYMTDIKNEQSIPVTKTWDDESYSQYRPASITYDLYRADDTEHENIISTITVTAQDNWQGSFEHIPLIDTDGETEIQYSVVERDVPYYSEETTSDHEILDLNRTEPFVYTPNYGLRINFSSATQTNGPLLIIWKDRVSGTWFSSSYGVGANSVVNLSATEAYLLYRSYGNYVGLDINNVEEAKSLDNWSLNGGYEWTEGTIDEIIQKAIDRYQGTSTWWTQEYTAEDFTEGSNGYHNSVAELDYNAEEVVQLVHVSRPEPTPVYTELPTPAELESAEGFRITLGDDYGDVCGPMPLVYKAENGKYASLYLSHESHSGQMTFDIKGKEFYLFYIENNGPHVPQNTGVADGTSCGIYGTGHSVASIEAISNGNWINTSNGSYDTPIAAANGYTTSLQTYFDGYTDGRLGAPIISTLNPSKTQAYSFIYTDDLPNQDMWSYYEEHGSYTAEPLEVKNTFVVRQFDVEFAKQDENENLIAGAHLELWKDGVKVSEWDTEEDKKKTLTLDHGTYTLKETRTPKGYATAEDIEFTLSPIGEITVGSTVVTSITMTDDIDKHDITVSKKVTGNSPDKDREYDFTISFTNGEWMDLPEELEYEKGEESGTIELEEMTAEFKLKQDESITFLNIPYGTEYAVEEIVPSEKYFIVTMKNEEGTVKNEDITVTVTNRFDVLIMHLMTGGNGTKALYAAATLLFGGACVLIIRKKRKKQR